MKADLFKKQWLDIVFEGRNKSYGAYELRSTSTKTNFIALGLGAVIFAIAVASPKIIEKFSSGSNDDEALKVTKVKLDKIPPKEKEKPKEIPKTPPPPPPPPIDQVKFVKPVVAKKEDVTEEIQKIDDLKDKKVADKDVKGDPTKDFDMSNDYGKGDERKKVEDEDDNKVYDMSGVEQAPEFPGGIAKFYAFVGKNYDVEAIGEPGLNGKVIVSFLVDKDGSISEVKAIKDIGFGTGKEAEKVLRKCPKWIPAEQNGRKVACRYQLPITIQTPEE
ncbi:energy transducer TonB [Flavobacterium croceum]|mgnify:CR=1 FL=1|uniref:energy transducer TonB n=1 Tax=Flavobacterium croceum TaxID=370975 RepID=UPI0024A83ABF|nr:energy transducer TonB [Flavobacterium croceum]